MTTTAKASLRLIVERPSHLSQVNAEYHGHQERMVGAQRALQKLGNDPFNLGKFAVSS